MIGLVIDRAVGTGDGGSMLRWAVALAALFACLSAAGCTALWLEERAVMGANHRVRTAVARRALDALGHGSLPAGEVIGMSSIEASRVADGVGTVIMGVGAVTGTLVGAAVLLSISVPLGLVVLVGLPVVLLATHALTAPLVNRAEAQQAAVGAAAGIAGDLLHGLRVLKGLGAEAAGVASYRRASGEALRAALDANRVRSAYSGITLTIAGGFLLLVAWLAGRAAIDGDVSVGELVAALGVTQFLVGPLSRLSATGALLAHARAASARLGEVLGAPGAGLPSSSGTVLVGGDGNSVEVPSIGLRVAAGEHIGVVAPSPGDGAALVAALDVDEHRGHVVVAHHDAPLLEATPVEELAAVGAERTEVAAVLAAASAEDAAAAVEVLGEGGRSLSGGQRQRIALARALAADPPVLVLHEPTTAVDAVTEQRIATGMREQRAGRTTIVVTTSPALLAAADRVALVIDGAVVASGTHATLVADDRYRAAVLA